MHWSQDVEVVYRGIESGQIEAVFKAATPESLARPYRTGLEGSAVGGNYPCSIIFRGLLQNLIIV